MVLGPEGVEYSGIPVEFLGDYQMPLYNHIVE